MGHFKAYSSASNEIESWVLQNRNFYNALKQFNISNRNLIWLKWNALSFADWICSLAKVPAWCWIQGAFSELHHSLYESIFSVTLSLCQLNYHTVADSLAAFKPILWILRALLFI